MSATPSSSRTVSINDSFVAAAPSEALNLISSQGATISKPETIPPHICEITGHGQRWALSKSYLASQSDFCLSLFRSKPASETSYIDLGDVHKDALLWLVSDLKKYQQNFEEGRMRSAAPDRALYEITQPQDVVHAFLNLTLKLGFTFQHRCCMLTLFMLASHASDPFCETASTILVNLDWQHLQDYADMIVRDFMEALEGRAGVTVPHFFLSPRVLSAHPHLAEKVIRAMSAALTSGFLSADTETEARNEED